MSAWWLAHILSVLASALALSESDQTYVRLLRQSGTATPVGKVTEMLQEMKTKSETMKKEEAKEHAEVEKTCTEISDEKEKSIEDLGTQVETLTAEIEATKVEIEELEKGIMEHEGDLITAHSMLKDERTTRREQEAAFSEDITEMNFAIDAVERATETLEAAAKKADKLAKGKSLLQVLSRVDAGHDSWREVAKILRKVSEEPFAKDEHIFDEFGDTGTSDFSSSSGGAVDTLKKLKTTFDKERTKIMDKEKENRGNFEKLQASLLEQIQTDTEGQASKKATKAEKEEDLATKEKAFEDTSLNKADTTAYLTKYKASCEKKAAAFKESQEMRAKEIEALTKALEIITGTVQTSASKHLPSLITAGRPRVKRARIDAEEESDDENKVLGFLRLEAQKLDSKSLLSLADHLKSITSSTRALAKEDPKEDPLDKVRDLVKSLIEHLEEQAAQEAEQKAWCDDQLAKNAKLQKEANAEIDKHTAKIEAIEGDILKLGEELADLEASVKKTTKQKEELEKERTEEKAKNEETIDDADTAAEATDAAIEVLTEFYENATKKSALIEAKHKMKQPQDSSGVIGMLEVVRDDFKRLAQKTRDEEAEAASLYKANMQEMEVMLASAEKDIEYKTESKENLEKALPESKEDLKMSSTELDNAKATFEKLKPPCLDVETYEERKAKRDAEIAALEEALQMIQDFDNAQGTFIQVSTSAKQEEQKQKVIEAFREMKKGDPTAVEKVTGLLTKIRDDVKSDLDEDKKVYKEMQKWCKENMEDKLSTIDASQDRDRVLVTTVETSAQQKAQLEVQLKNAMAELAKDQEALATATELREKENREFMDEEKEVLQSIHGLKSAMVVLANVFGDGSEAKEESSKKLVQVASEVQSAMKALPSNEMTATLTTITSNAALRQFFENPKSLLAEVKSSQPISLAQSPEGSEVFGVLKGLLEQFEAELQSCQTNEKNAVAQFEELKKTKEASITALQESISSKQGQLAHHTTVLAQSKEDLTNLRASLSADSKFLQSVTLQCQEADHEFAQRSKTREQEIAALNEAIDTLTAGQGTVDGAQRGADGSSSKSLLKFHHVHQPGRIFVTHRNRSNTVTLKPKPKPQPTTTPSPESVMDAYMKKAKKSKKKSKHSVKGKHPANVFVELGEKQAVSWDKKVVDLSPEALRQKGAKLLAALVTGVRLEHAAKGDSLTNEALQKVITKVDDMRKELQKEQASEQKMRDLCIKEDNEASMEIERMETEQQGYNITKERQTKIINDCDHNIDKINATINDMKDEMDEKQKERKEQHEAFRKSVKEQEESQKVLYSAKQALQNFYDGKTALLQKPKTATVLPSASLPTIPALDAGTPKWSIASPALHVATKTQASNASSKVASGTATPSKAITDSKSAAPPKKAAKVVPVPKTIAHATVAVKSTRTQKADAKAVAVKKNRQDPDDPLGEKSKMPQFSTKSEGHGGGVGVIGIIDLLIEESQTLVEEIVEAEEAASQAYIDDLNDTKRSIEEKDREIIALQQDKGTAEVELQETKDLDVTLLTEMEQMYKFREMLHSKCNFLLENFDKTQAARTAEMEGLLEAKHQLQGMTSLQQLPTVAGSAALVQKHQATAQDGQFLAR